MLIGVTLRGKRMVFEWFSSKVKLSISQKKELLDIERDSYMAEARSLAKKRGEVKAKLEYKNEDKKDF